MFAWGVYQSIAYVVIRYRFVEEELKSAKDDAEAAAKIKSEFLFNMNNEIRAPMNAIIGLPGLLERTDFNLEKRDYIETIKTSGDSSLSVINNTLDF